MVGLSALNRCRRQRNNLKERLLHDPKFKKEFMEHRHEVQEIYWASVLPQFYHDIFLMEAEWILAGKKRLGGRRGVKKEKSG